MVLEHDESGTSMAIRDATIAKVTISIDPISIQISANARLG